jgi:hypothetical protein
MPALIYALSLALITGAGPTPNETISRAYTVLNQRVVQSEAISRSVTVLNIRSPAPSEHHSRAATVLNQSPVKPGEAISRPDTILNLRPHDTGESISRAMTVCDVGDFNLNGQLDFGDIELFVETLLNVDADLNRTWAADMNCDFVTDALDIQEFIDSLLR